MIAEVPNTEITVEDSLDVSVGSCEVEVVDLADLDVTVSKKEYVITGDEVYIPMLYDDAPQWMKDLVQVVVDVAVESNNFDLINNMMSIVSEFATSYVPLNQYTQTVVNLGDEDARINGLITTLNSNVSDGLTNANAQIVELQLTKASKTEVVAQVIQTISAQLADGASSLGATVGRIDQAIADETSARASSFEVVMASLEDTNLDVTANAAATSTLSAYVGIDPNGGLTGTGLLADVQVIQNQLDGVIETATGTYDVITYTLVGGEIDPASLELVVTAEPYASWVAEEAVGAINVRSAHIGDTYIKYVIDPVSGVRNYDSSYKFIKTVVDSTTPYGTDADGFTWAKVLDQVSEEVYMTALAALDLADSKRRVFVSTPIPPYDVGDIWLVQSGATIIGTTQGGRVIQAGDMLRCTEDKGSGATYEHNDWVPADNYRESMNAIQTDLNTWRTGTYAPFVSSIQSQVDGKAETFYQSSVPAGRIRSINVTDNVTLNKYVGDLWKNTYVGTISGYLGDNTEYVYTKKANGTNWDYDWTKMEVPDIVFDTIDTKKSIYSGNSVPVAVAPDVIEINDMWITGTGVVGFDKESVYIWNGSAWVKPLKYTDDTAVTTLSNGLADGTTMIKLSNAFIGDTALTDYIVNEIDGKVSVYSGTTAPINGEPDGVMLNDIYIWFTTGSKTLANGIIQVYDVNRTYKYNGTVWNEITTNSNITALADLADGKRTVFSGNTVPVGAVVNDVWIPSTTNGSYIKGEVYQYIGSPLAWVIATKYSSDIAALSSSIQTQIDGKVDTYYQATVPFTNAVNVAKRSSGGDYWYCTQDGGSYLKGKIYKYVESANGSNFNYTWTLTTDISRDAFDLADGKSAIFVTTSLPTTYSTNDMMIVVGSFNNGTTSFSDGVVLTSTADSTSFVAAHWIKRINDTEDLDAYKDVVNPQLTSLQNQVDGKVESWYTLSTSDPKLAWTDSITRGKHNGDLWYQTDTKLSYYYSSSTNSWNLIDDAKAILALSNAAAAQATADGVVVSYYAIRATAAPSTSKLWLDKTGTLVLKEYTTSWVPVSVKEGDTLTAYDVDTKDTYIYVYYSGGWITETANGIVASSEAITDLTADLSALGTTVSGHTSELSTVNARIASGVAAVDSKWVYNSSLIIGGVSYNSGFGLVSTFTGTPNPSNPPVGTSEFWISADKFKLTTTGYTGTKYSPFTVNSNNGEITFNGKVSFANTTGVPDFATSSELDSVTSNVNSLTASLSSLADSVEAQDGLVTTIYSSVTPTVNINFGDYWLNTSSGPTYNVYRYQGAGGLNNTPLSWVVSYSATAKSIQSAYKAQKTADGKINTYYQTGAPTGTLVIGDIWIDTDDNYKQYRWGGTTWIAVAYNPATAVNAGTTTIDGPKITTGSITAAQIAADSVSADRLKSTTGASTVWEGGGLVSANFNGNVNGDIGTPTAGFRLSSNAAGTSSDPNVYGAYIKGASIEGSVLTGSTVSINDLKVRTQSYPANYCSFDLRYKYLNNVDNTTTTINSDVYVAQSAGTGLNILRMARNAQIFELSLNVFGYGDNITSSIEVSVNGGAWAELLTRSQYHSTSLMTTYSHITAATASIQFRAVVTTTSGTYDAGVSFEVYSKNA